MRIGAIRYWGILLTGGILSGCLSYAPQGTGIKKGADSTHLEAIAYFDYTRGETWRPLGESRDWGLYRVQKLRLPASLRIDIKQNEYTLYYYQPKGHGPFPGIII